MIGSDSQDVQRFQRWSGSYERSLGQVFLFNPVHRAVLRMAGGHFDGRAPACVADIGCGTGRLLRRAALQWPAARRVGVDPAEGMIEIARRLTPTATFVVGRGEGLPFADSSVDLVFSTLSFHHRQDQAAGVREVARVLRPMGVFCLADGALPTVAGALIGHSRIHTREELSALLRQEGLAVILQKGIIAGGVVATMGEKR
jgi:SAM-dependent methyltransferase